jgi:hypothetical protein
LVIAQIEEKSMLWQSLNGRPMPMKPGFNGNIQSAPPPLHPKGTDGRFNGSAKGLRAFQAVLQTPPTYE